MCVLLCSVWVYLYIGRVYYFGIEMALCEQF